MSVANLLHWTVLFLVVAVIAGVLGFGGLAAGSVGAAKILFWLAIILAILAYIGHTLRRV